MAAAVVRHAGARHVVITDLNPYRLELARKMGVTLAVNPHETPLSEVQKTARHAGGLRRWSRNVRQRAAFRDMIANMSHGGKIAMLGIPPKEMAIDWNQVIFNMLTIKGIYGREMYETWYKMTVMLESGLDISARHHAPVCSWTRITSKALRRCDSGDCGKVILDWRESEEERSICTAAIREPSDRTSLTRFARRACTNASE